MDKATDVFMRREGDVVIVNIKGDVTAQSEQVIEDAYEKISSSGYQKILLHFDENAYINSGGIAVLITMLAKSRKNNQVIYMTGLSDHFQKIFHMVGITNYSKIYSSEPEALQDFA